MIKLFILSIVLSLHIATPVFASEGQTREEVLTEILNVSFESGALGYVEKQKEKNPNSANNAFVESMLKKVFNIQNEINSCVAKRILKKNDDLSLKDLERIRDGMDSKFYGYVLNFLYGDELDTINNTYFDHQKKCVLKKNDPNRYAYEENKESALTDSETEERIVPLVMEFVKSRVSIPDEDYNCMVKNVKRGLDISDDGLDAIYTAEKNYKPVVEEYFEEMAIFYRTIAYAQKDCQE